VVPEKAKHWGTGMTLSYLLGSSSKKKLAEGVGSLTGKHLEKLTSALAIPLPSIVAATYQVELFRLYGVNVSSGTATEKENKAASLRVSYLVVRLRRMTSLIRWRNFGSSAILVIRSAITRLGKICVASGAD